jgi:predicted component of type VI protein secretion system
MPLILSVRNADRLAFAVPPPIRLDERGCVIGRAPDVDWTLTDDRNTVSARHCEIAYRDGGYVIVDSSTNGTFVNGNRLTGPVRLAEGDVIRIGPFELAAKLSAPEPGPRGEAPLPGTAMSVGQTRLPGTTSYPAPGVTPSTTPASGAAIEHLLRAAGLRRDAVRSGDGEILAAAGQLLRQMAASLGALLDLRRRAITQMGANIGRATTVRANPLERPVDQALAQMLSTPDGSGLSGAQAVEQALADLDAHQLALLKAMQGAMRATLEQISPDAIRRRAGGAKAKEAALWKAYEEAFAGTPQDRENSFIEIFAKEFRQAYEALATKR